MLNRILGVLALAIALILGIVANSRLTYVRAQTQTAPQLQQMSTPIGTIPKEWGSLRGISDKFLIFEDSSGTIRMASIESGLHNFVEVKRQ